MDYRDVFFVVTGPTATGKTARAVHLAKAIGGEIISADSRQIYRGMDIGTGKDLAEYDGVPYHLIDIRPAGYRYSLYEFLEDFERAYDDIRGRGKPVRNQSGRRVRSGSVGLQTLGGGVAAVLHQQQAGIKNRRGPGGTGRIHNNPGNGFN